MIKKIFNKIKYMLAFGMKGANDEILSQDIRHADIGIIQTMENHNLGEALLKGEVTQQVEELRYSNYLINKESKNYSYIGDGNAIKKHTRQQNLTNFSFIQNNSMICESVGHELNRIGEYGTDRYTFQIIYDDITRFKIENYITYGKFIINNNNVTIEFYFDKNLKNKFDPTSYGILNELLKISKFNNAYEIEHNDICSNVKMLGFTTYKANGEDDLIEYMIQNLKFNGCKEYDDFFVLTYISNNYNRIDLTEKFHSKTMEEKYSKKTAKTQTYNLFENERKAYCEICGKEMNVYDSDITKQDYGKSICKDCLKDFLNIT